MSTPQWLTIILAALTVVVSSVNIALTAWLNRRVARSQTRDDEFREFVKGARALQADDAADQDRTADLLRVRHAAAGIELYAPDALPAARAALAAVERLVRLRAEHGWAEKIQEADAAVDTALATVGETFRTRRG